RRPPATGRPWAVAMKGATAAASTARTASVRPGCTEDDSSQRPTRPPRKNRSADRLFHLFRRLAARDAPGHRHRPTGAWILHSPRLAARHGKRSEADEGDRVASLQRG